MQSVRYVVFALVALIVLIAVVGTSFHGVPWYEELKNWQDGIAAIIAFAGLMIAALVGLDGVRNQIAANAREAQRKFEREKTTDHLRIAAVIAAEIYAVVEMLTNYLSTAKILLRDATPS